MDIIKKIEQIREKPEHIRMRYVIICVTISTLLIVGVWVMSLKSSFNNPKEITEDENSLQILNNLKDDLSTEYKDYKSESSNNLDQELQVISVEESANTENEEDVDDNEYNLFDLSQ